MFTEPATIDFYRYPPIGTEDWEYGFQTAMVRVLDSVMLTRAMMLDVANAESFESAVELLNGSDYALGSASPGLADIENMLLEKRTETRELFAELMIDERITGLLRAREDFANMRLAVRRLVTERPIGLDYSNDGSVPAEEFEEIFETENYSRFPEYLQEAVEAAVLGYYQNKDIRQIDYAIDKYQAGFNIKSAAKIDSIFLDSLFRTRIDLNNIRTMLRLKMADRDEKELFIDGGFVGIDRLVHGLDVGYEAMGALFYATPYHNVVDNGVNYLNKNKSFLHLEKYCEQHLMGFLKTTNSIASGPQPVIAYFLAKENEIRIVRLLLSCKKNSMDAKTILDRLVE
ncbi:MAG: V-type ATPase subunit [Planctomycetes bacterium]|nr:V-type ATPase subunit [Planctomycetota bacterium]